MDINYKIQLLKQAGILDKAKSMGGELIGAAKNKWNKGVEGATDAMRTGKGKWDEFVEASNSPELYEAMVENARQTHPLYMDAADIDPKLPHILGRISEFVNMGQMPPAGELAKIRQGVGEAGTQLAYNLGLKKRPPHKWQGFWDAIDRVDNWEAGGALTPEQAIRLKRDIWRRMDLV